MRHRSVLGAALAGVSAVAMMMAGSPALAATSRPSWAVNSLLADGMSAFYLDAKDNLSRWCHPIEGTSQTCNLRFPTDLGVIPMGETYSGQYETNGYLSDYDYEVERRPDYGLTVQTYEATLQPGHWGYFEVSNVAETNCPAPITVAVRGESTATGDKPEEYVYASWLGSKASYSSVNNKQSFADWLLAPNESYSWSSEAYKNGDSLWLRHVSYGGGGVGVGCGGGYIANNLRNWFFVQNGGTKPSKVKFSLAGANADAIKYRNDGTVDYSTNKFNVTYMDSPVKLDSDVSPTSPHAADIAWLKAQGISKGFPDGTFGGMRTVVRQDMAAFLYRLAGSPAFDVDAELAKHPFTDVDKNTSHYEAILWLASKGIVKGYDNGNGTVSFGGMRTVVRQDMAAFLNRYAKWAGASEPTGQGIAFTDVNPSASHHDEIVWLSKTGVTTGFDNGNGTVSFGGMRDVVRQDMAAFLHRMSANVLAK